MKRKQASGGKQVSKHKRQATGAYVPVRATAKSPYVQTMVPRGSLPASFTPTGAEIKAVDIAGAVYPFRGPATATNLILLNGIQTGTAFYNRIGSRVEMKNLQIKGNVEAGANNNDGALLRFLIIYDRQPTGALPTVADILQDRSQAGTSNTTGSSSINLDNRDRFSIIRDMCFESPVTTITGGTASFTTSMSGNSRDLAINEFIKLKGLGTHFKSTANPATISDIATGALYAMFVTNGNDSAWDFAGVFRLRFEDK